MKNFNSIASVLVLVASLSACGKKGGASNEAQTQNTTDGSQTSQTSLAKNLKATCLLPDVDAGWKEVSVEDLRKTPGKVVYVMNGMVNNAVIVRKDGKTASANAVLTAQVNEKFELADVKQEVPCSDLQEGDKITLKGMPVLAFTASNGAYARRLAYLYELSPTATADDNQAKDFEPQKTGSFFDDLSSQQSLQMMKAQKSDVTVRYLMNSRGDLELRVYSMSPVLEDGSRKLLSVAVRYSALTAEKKDK